MGCFPAARALKQAPPALAARVAGGFQAGPLLAAATATGPFVNFRADRGALYRSLFRAALVDRALIPRDVAAGRTIVLDYSSPNISKHLAYHHIRGTVIGQALCNMHRALGARVVGINYLGDWGTTHGQLIAAYKKWGAPSRSTSPRSTTSTSASRRPPRTTRPWARRARPGSSSWRRVTPRRMRCGSASAMCRWPSSTPSTSELGIVFDEVRGEADFVPEMPAVLEMLEQKGLSGISEGALVVPLDDLGMPPLLLRKRDGATLYATRDLASAIYRWRTYHFDRSLYVVAREQGLHFKQLFATLARAGFEWSSRCEHIQFGFVRLGGKKTGTRIGNVVLLRDVLREAKERARERVREKNPDMSEAELAETARVVGIGAIVFANMVTQRDKDVDFDWEDILSTDGDTGPYVQYAHARCSSVLGKAGEVSLPELAGADPAPLEGDLEWAVARALVDFPDVVAKAAEQSEPHLLSRYLLDLGAAYSRWYTAGNTDHSQRILSPEPATRSARLALLATTRETLRQGLALLGLGAPDVM